MKDLKIGEETYQLCEGVDDLYDIRFPLFMQYLRMSVEGVDKPLFAATIQRAESLMNKGEFHKAFMEFVNYQTSIELPEVNITGLSMCFAVIVLNEDEDQSDTNEGKLKKKLTAMRKAGLTRGMVEDTVTNFIKASPDSFGDYGVLMETISMMKNSPQSEV